MSPALGVRASSPQRKRQAGKMPALPGVKKETGTRNPPRPCGPPLQGGELFFYPLSGGVPQSGGVGLVVVTCQEPIPSREGTGRIPFPPHCRLAAGRRLISLHPGGRGRPHHALQDEGHDQPNADDPEKNGSPLILHIEPGLRPVHLFTPVSNTTQRMRVAGPCPHHTNGCYDYCMQQTARHTDRLHVGTGPLLPRQAGNGRMHDMKEQSREESRVVEIVRSDYQPSQAELDEAPPQCSVYRGGCSRAG